MKRVYLKIFITVFIISLYLYLAHSYIYYKIQAANLYAPARQASYLIDNSTSAGKNLVYLALGDSLTAGVGASKYEETYPYLLAKKLSAANGITLYNLAVPGARTADVINNMLIQTMRQRPDIITLLIGTNDIHGNVSKIKFKKNYTAILENLTKNTEAKIYLISVPFIGPNTLFLPPYNYYYDHETAEYNEIIMELAKNYNLNYINLSSPTKKIFKRNGPHYAADLFHPSASGYALWSEIIYADISQ